MLEVLQWLAINTILPLFPIVLFYLGIWLLKRNRRMGAPH
jgi:hypothetical protein